MNIETFLKCRDFALFQAEVFFDNKKPKTVNLLEVQVYSDIQDQLEGLFEFDILPDCVFKNLNDGWMYVAVLLDVLNSEDFKIIQCDSSPLNIEPAEDGELGLPF